jgi:hypothetical protein
MEEIVENCHFVEDAGSEFLESLKENQNKKSRNLEE